jgi:small subunit ribosomal protein S16
MAVRIRLTRVGAKKQPTYRVVVADSRSARDSRSIETLGHYNPRKDPVEFEVDAEKAKAWMAKGALPSDTVARLFRNVGVLPADSAPKYPKVEKPAKPVASAKADAAPKAAKPAPAASAEPAEAAEGAESAEPEASAESAETAASAEGTETAGSTETPESTDEEASK